MTHDEVNQTGHLGLDRHVTVSPGKFSRAEVIMAIRENWTRYKQNRSYRCSVTNSHLLL